VKGRHATRGGCSVISFSIIIRFDTPLFQGGPESQKPDPLGLLRGESLRGLMHTWARAIIAPLVGEGNIEAVKKAEQALFGYAAGERDEEVAPPDPRDFGFATFRMHDITLAEGDRPSLVEMGTASFPVCAHTDNPQRRGHPSSGAPRTVKVSFRRDAVKRDPDLPKMIWTVLWTALSLGSLGQRARRGYGSLTITDVTGLEKSVLGALTPYPGYASQDEVAAWIGAGFTQAQANTRTWLEKNKTPLTASVRTDEHSFFQIGGCDQIRVGTPDQISANMREGLLCNLMLACRRARKDNSQEQYREFLGSHNPRRASPLWFRVFRLSDGRYVPVTVYSPPKKGISPIVNSVVNAIGINYPG